jgi:hypothetical protein
MMVRKKETFHQLIYCQFDTVISGYNILAWMIIRRNLLNFDIFKFIPVKVFGKEVGLLFHTDQEEGGDWYFKINPRDYQ